MCQICVVYVDRDVIVWGYEICVRGRERVSVVDGLDAHVYFVVNRNLI